MKIRTGFVSNSSSSSFVLLCSKDIYEKALSKLDEEQRDFIESIPTLDMDDNH